MRGRYSSALQVEGGTVLVSYPWRGASIRLDLTQNIAQVARDVSHGHDGGLVARGRLAPRKEQLTQTQHHRVSILKNK